MQKRCIHREAFKLYTHRFYCTCACMAYPSGNRHHIVVQHVYPPNVISSMTYPSSCHRCILTVVRYCVGTVLDSICIHTVVRYMCGHRSRHQMHTRRCWICCRNCPPSIAIVVRNALVFRRLLCLKIMKFLRQLLEPPWVTRLRFAQYGSATSGATLDGMRSRTFSSFLDSKISWSGWEHVVYRYGLAIASSNATTWFRRMRCGTLWWTYRHIFENACHPNIHSAKINEHL